MGLVINRPSPLSTNELLEHLGIDCVADYPQQVLLGGPVSVESGMLLYRVDADSAGHHARLDEVHGHEPACAHDEQDQDDGVGLGQTEQVVVALDVAGPVLETLPAVGRLVQLQKLDLRAHRAVEDDDALAREFGERMVVERVTGQATSLRAVSAEAGVRLVASQTVTVRPSCPAGGSTSVIVGQSNPEWSNHSAS